MGSREIVLAAGFLAVVLGVIAFRSWADRRRFGP
jgi:hypothetical protein